MIETIGGLEISRIEIAPNLLIFKIYNFFVCGVGWVYWKYGGISSWTFFIIIILSNLDIIDGKIQKVSYTKKILNLKVNF